MSRKPHRQGDVLFVPVDEIPKGVKAVERDTRGRIVLAEGESTGHAHCVLDDPVTLFAMDDLNEMADRFLAVEQGHVVDAPVYEERETGRVVMKGESVKTSRKVTKHRSETCPVKETVQVGTVKTEGVLVTHEEHNTLVLEPGNWVVRNKREYAPERPRIVMD
jgi:hypothetical protein